MRTCNLLVEIFVLFALASSIAGYDPSILQDFCVAIEDTKSAGKCSINNLYFSFFPLSIMFYQHYKLFFINANLFSIYFCCC